ncbi:MAG: deoxyribose-phosphate aldolase [Candidatus Hodarchaeota archaeon]
MTTVVEIAKIIDHSLLHPMLTDEELIEGCKLAKENDIASVCIKPYAVKRAVEILKDSNVCIGTVVGFPHGSSQINVKTFEAEQACKDGATKLDMVVNIGKVLSEDWEYVEEEIKGIVDVASKFGAKVKVIFENDFLLNDHYKIKLCETCSKLKVDFVKTSTGFGFMKGKDGKYSYNGASDHDLKLTRFFASKEVQVKAAGNVRTLDDVLRVRNIGVTRIGATATEIILEEARKRF